MPEKPPYPPPRYYRHLSALLPLSPPLLLSLPCPLPLQILLIGLAHSPYCSYLHPCVLPTPQILPIGLLPPPPAPILAPAHLSPLQILLIGLAPSPYCSYPRPCAPLAPTDPADRPTPPPIAPILNPVLIACIDYGESPSYGILRGVGEGTVCRL